MTPHAIPYSFAEAREAASRFQAAQRAGEDALRAASEKLAEAERVYRKALARKIVEVNAEGAAWTVSQDLARGDDTVADLRYERDVAKGVFEATQTASWRHTANRKDCLALIEWSARAPDGYRDERPQKVAA